MELHQGDVDLFQTLDGGDISMSGGIIAMSGGLETSVYLALFGGNEDDEGKVGDSQQWWGNLLETNDSFKYTSATQNLMKSFPLVSSSIPKAEKTALRDLNYLIVERIASKVSVVVSIPALNSVAFDITIQAKGEQINLRYVQNWSLPQPVEPEKLFSAIDSGELMTTEDGKQMITEDNKLMVTEG